MERPERKIDRIVLRTIIASLIIGLVSSTIISPYRQAAYAHTFTGDESASFMSLIKLLQAEADLVQTNLANITLAQDHAKAVVDEINGNHTFGVLPDEVSENNKRVAADVIHAGEALQTAVKSAPLNPTGVKAKLDNLNSTLQEAVAVRLPQDAPKNFTINLIGTKDLVNETLRQYGYSHGIANSHEANALITSIVNMSAYQTAKSLTSQAQDMFTQAKSLVPSNATSTTKTAMTNIASDLSQLKNLVDGKSPYEKVATLVQKTVYPDIDKSIGMK
ncbi:hypothetical protein [Nitrososphaera sp. AFS]|uniref:hypothetical protein n=1 Tax=Nitrososphaera sp. AFS TaxID=2301191 RepID=UPI001392281C|nr:hypothetical protein [Nitrososphaera sp. AFS]NAL77957.1 hypothetical protein [Nitrososphaera sp. AFS]